MKEPDFVSFGPSMERWSVKLLVEPIRIPATSSILTALKILVCVSLPVTCDKRMWTEWLSKVNLASILYTWLGDTTVNFSN